MCAFLSELEKFRYSTFSHSKHFSHVSCHLHFSACHGHALRAEALSTLSCVTTIKLLQQVTRFTFHESNQLHVLERSSIFNVVTNVVHRDLGEGHVVLFGYAGKSPAD